jgi:AAA domain
LATKTDWCRRRVAMASSREFPQAEIELWPVWNTIWCALALVVRAAAVAGHTKLDDVAGAQAVAA